MHDNFYGWVVCALLKTLPKICRKHLQLQEVAKIYAQYSDNNLAIIAVGNKLANKYSCASNNSDVASNKKRCL